MFPLSRTLAAWVIGVGAAGVTAGAAAPVFINAQPTIPLHLQELTWSITDDSATTRLIQNGRQLTVPVTAQWHLSLAEPASNHSVTARIGSTFMRHSDQAESQRLIHAQVWTFPMDRLLGVATGPARLFQVIGMPETNEVISGQWFKFPANAEKTTYDVFDETLHAAAPAVFDHETTINGRTVYVYHQDVAPTNVALRYASPFNTADFGAKGTGYLYHSATRDLYVDQHSGLLVDMDVNIKDYYATKEGTPLADALLFKGSISEADTAHLLDQARAFHSSAFFNAVRWTLLICGALFILVGIWAAFRP